MNKDQFKKVKAKAFSLGRGKFGIWNGALECERELADMIHWFYTEESRKTWEDKERIELKNYTEEQLEYLRNNA